MSYSIQKLTKTDLDLAEKLIKSWYADEGDFNPKIPKDKHLSTLMAKDDFHIYVAIENGEVIGGLTAYELQMFDLEKHEMFLYEIGVSSKHRKKGVAKQLIESLKQTCTERNVKVIFVATSLDNKAAKQLYASTGGELEVVPFYTYNL